MLIYDHFTPLVEMAALELRALHLTVVLSKEPCQKSGTFTLKGK